MTTFDAFREFLSGVEQGGELIRIRAEVDPNLEVAAITDRVCKASDGGKALYFERVRGYRYPMLTNLFGSAARLKRALGSSSEDLAERLQRGLASYEGEAGVRLRLLLQQGQWAPLHVEEPACRQIVEGEKPDLLQIPALKSWPGDGGRYLTLPLVFTADVETGEPNCGMYRMQVLDGRTAALHWRSGSDASMHYDGWSRQKRDMPVAVAIGADPALIYAAGAPLPTGVDEAAFAGFLRGRPMEMCSCLNSSLKVPASAEFVIEGLVSWEESVTEGPFGNHTGFYAPATLVPKMKITAITSRNEPLFPCTLVGPPPMEDCHLARITEKLFLPYLQLQVPEVLDLHYFTEGIFHGCAALRVGGDARQGSLLMERLWETELLKKSKMLILFDETVDIRNPSETLWRAFNNVRVQQDLQCRAEQLGIDARNKGIARTLESDEDIQRMVRWRWREYGL